jgi:glycine cleavage system aminomethyltransferase T
LRRTALYERHAAAGAKLVPFAGWEMPIQYAGIREEHVRVRGDAGVFDVSHMGQVETRGPDAQAFPRVVPSTASCAATTAACSTTCSPIGWPTATT